jgi:hypothetical protein
LVNVLPALARGKMEQCHRQQVIEQFRPGRHSALVRRSLAHVDCALNYDKKFLSIGESAFAKDSDNSGEDDASILPKDLPVPILGNENT